MTEVDDDGCEPSHADPRRVEALVPRLVTGPVIETLASTFKVLGDATRLRLLDALSKQELCVCDLAGIVGLSESAVSHQLRLLRGWRLVRSRRSGRLVFYSLADDHILSLLGEGLRHVEEESPRRPATRAER